MIDLQEKSWGWNHSLKDHQIIISSLPSGELCVETNCLIYLQILKAAFEGKDESVEQAGRKTSFWKVLWIHESLDPDCDWSSN